MPVDGLGFCLLAGAGRLIVSPSVPTSSELESQAKSKSQFYFRWLIRYVDVGKHDSRARK
jgi:hypothetical protein